MRQIKLRAILSGILMAAALLSVAGAARAVDPPKPLARPGTIILKVSPGTASSVLDKLIADAGCEMIKPLAYSPDVYLVGVKGRNVSIVSETPSVATTQAVAKLRSSPGVLAGPDYMRFWDGIPQRKLDATGRKSRATAPPGTAITPNDPELKNEWHLDMMRAPEAWNIQFSKDSNPTLVGVIDSGVESGHPDFADGSGGSRVIDHQNFGGGTAGSDIVGHGTHVAGTVGATTNNANRVSSIAGWDNNGLKVRIIDAAVSDTTGGLSSSGIIQAINYCVSKGVKVINMSLGGYFDDPTERQTIKAAIDAGVVICASAGNASLDTSTIAHYPSDYPGVICVTAVGHDKKLTAYSNYGFVENPQLIAAPGGTGDGVYAHDVLSTWPIKLVPQIGPGNNGINAIAGTSMASPNVAGVAALLSAAGVSGAEMYKALSDGAQLPNEALTAKKHGPGVVDAYSSLLPFSDPSPSLLVEGGTDRGNSHFGATPISVSLRGVGRIYASGPPAGTTGLWALESDLSVEVQTIGRTPSIVKAFVGGRNVAGQSNRFEIPTLPAGASKALAYTGIRVPALNTDGSYSPLMLSPGQYRIVGKINLRNATGLVSTTETIQFITIVEKRLNAGRSMFAMPFAAGDFIRTVSQPNQTPESAMLGSATSFGLAYYNPLRGPSDDDYARFRSNDPYTLKSAVRWDVADQLTNRVTVFDTTNPSVSIAPIGLGYWLDLDRAGSVSTTLLPFPGQIPGVSPVVENSVGIKVYASGGGWNMIGAPFTYPVDWSVVTVGVDGVSYSIAEAVKAGLISPALIGYANGDYVYSIAPAGQLEPFNGYWIRAFRDMTLYVPPVKSASITRSTQGGASGNDGWRARLVANVAGDVDGQNYFGQLRNADSNEDINDIPKPPAAGHAYVSFLQKSRSLAFDIRGLSGSAVGHEEWTALVKSDRPNASVTLSWDGIRTAPRNARFILLDKETGAKIAMSNVSSYTYKSGAPGTSRAFTITMESQPSAGVLAIRPLRAMQAGRAAKGWTFGVVANMDVDLEAYVETFAGHRVAVMSAKTRAQAGRATTLAWDGRNTAGGYVAPGPYRVKVIAKTADGQTAVQQATITNVR